MSVNLKLLNAFLLIAEHGSFRRAAELTRRSQSALSLQLRELEVQLGASLFHRTTRKVTLTREGEALLPHARRAIAEMEAGLRSVAVAASMQGGRLSLGCAPHIAEAVLPPLLAAFHRRHPGVAVQICEMLQAEVLEAVRRQELDFGIGPRPANAPSLTFEALQDEAILALAPPRFASRDPRGMALKALGAVPVIITSGTNSLREMLEEAAASIGVSMAVICEVKMPATAIALASEGLGVAIIPQLALPTRRLPGLRVLRIIEPPLLREVGLVQLRGSRLSAAAVAMQALLRARLGTTQPSPGSAGPAVIDASFPGAARRSTNGSKRLPPSDHKRVSSNN